MQVHHTDDAHRAARESAPFLHTDPVAHNVLLTVLAERQAAPAPGHYWWVRDADEVIGFAMQSPRTYAVGLAPADDEVIAALVHAVRDSSDQVPGVVGNAAPAAHFAGRWTELTSTGARPTEGQRLCVLETTPSADPIDAHPATMADLELVIDWLSAFSAETGMDPPAQPGHAATTMIESGRLQLSWLDERPVAMARATPAVAGVSRIGWVYTPPSDRGRGHATQLVRHVSAQELAGDTERCVLYTQLSNPTSNAIYLRIGYRPVAEVLSYTFD
ncbi:MAG: GNAT family N-acetyltransferase [Acidimicrobiia bacterium]|nr:GNAT family N-acetyltransferase [Acidimicrobiia bacterium]